MLITRCAPDTAAGYRVGALFARRNIEAELSGGRLDASDVIVHGPQPVLQAAIMNSIEAILAGEPRRLRML
jgi:hypothetical protein